jgi:hypothetical protein
MDAAHKGYHKLLNLVDDQKLPVVQSQTKKSGVSYYNFTQNYISIGNYPSLWTKTAVLAHEYGHYVNLLEYPFVEIASPGPKEGRYHFFKKEIFNREQIAWDIAEQLLVSMRIMHYRSFYALKISAMQTYEYRDIMNDDWHTYRNLYHEHHRAAYERSREAVNRMW